MISLGIYISGIILKFGLFNEVMYGHVSEQEAQSYMQKFDAV